jgi:2-keto-4-pentenoate hydratase/2-oxohepta-3-ene-1,7-dioic acid hydratase in catechol pathway
MNCRREKNMRLVSFIQNESTRLGVLKNGGIGDLAKAAPDLPATLLGLIQAGDEAFKAAAKAADGIADSDLIPVDQVTLDIPLRGAAKILCLGLNYVDHAAEGGHNKPDYPMVFLRVESSLMGHGAAMVRPKNSVTLDWEAELVAVVGKTARHVSIDDALDYVCGYSCFNDGSVREYQRKSTQWTMGKNFDATGGFGPYFVTADELPLGAKGLKIECRLNGETMQSANTDDMIFDVATTLSLMSECLTLEPGDLLVMGTPAGVGHARRPPVWMKPGDSVEVEIEQIGTLVNPIVAEQT